MFELKNYTQLRLNFINTSWATAQDWKKARQEVISANIIVAKLLDVCIKQAKEVDKKEANAMRDLLNAITDSSVVVMNTRIPRHLMLQQFDKPTENVNDNRLGRDGQNNAWGDTVRRLGKPTSHGYNGSAKDTDSRIPISLAAPKKNGSADARYALGLVRPKVHTPF